MCVLIDLLTDLLYFFFLCSSMSFMQTQVEYQWQKKEIDDLQNSGICT